MMFRPAFAESIRRGIAERRGIEPAIYASLARRKTDALTGNDIGPVGGSRVGYIGRKIERIHRRTVLQSDKPAELPVAQHLRQVIDEPGTDAPGHVGE